jgi:hypothetical protein
LSEEARMSPRSTIILLSSLALALAACSNERDQKRAGMADEPRDGVEQEPEPEPDQRGDEDAGGAPVAPVPLTLWVDDLIDHHTTDYAEPDTVDDKVITDDTDEASFDKYLP